MKNSLLLILIFFLLSSCSKPKAVLICGDHVCVNKKEAEKYFEENLSLEVQIINKTKKKEINLVDLNLIKNNNDKRQVLINKKDKTKKKIKNLSREEVKKIKSKIKKKDSKIKNEKKVESLNLKEKEIASIFEGRTIDVVDVCTIIEKCSIDEISKFLLKQGKKKAFPDITIKE